MHKIGMVEKFDIFTRVILNLISLLKELDLRHSWNTKMND